MDGRLAGLRPGERILWTGTPATGFRFASRDLFLVPFGFLWCGFALFWEFSAARTWADWTFLLFGVPFVLIGLTIAVGRFPADAWLRRRTRYALTDRRVLIERDAPSGTYQSIDLASLGEIKLLPGRGGDGTILLGPQASFFGRGNGFDIWMPAISPTPQLQAIVDARGVLARILTAQERLRSGVGELSA